VIYFTLDHFRPLVYDFLRLGTIILILDVIYLHQLLEKRPRASAEEGASVLTITKTAASASAAKTSVSAQIWLESE
jgi:hypothetical protein